MHIEVFDPNTCLMQSHFGLYLPIIKYPIRHSKIYRSPPLLRAASSAGDVNAQRPVLQLEVVEFPDRHRSRLRCGEINMAVVAVGARPYLGNRISPHHRLNFLHQFVLGHPIGQVPEEAAGPRLGFLVDFLFAPWRALHSPTSLNFACLSRGPVLFALGTARSHHCVTASFHGLERRALGR